MSDVTLRGEATITPRPTQITLTGWLIYQDEEPNGGWTILSLDSPTSQARKPVITSPGTVTARVEITVRLP